MANGNLLSTLQFIRRSGRITRKELASLLKLGTSMVSKIVSELFEQGLICEVGRSEPESGRPHDLLALNPQAGYAVGLDIGGTHQYAVILNLTGDVVAQLAETARIPADRQAILDGLDQMIQRALALCDLPPCDVMGIGVGLRAVVNPETGVVSSWTETPEMTSTWKDFAVRDVLVNRWSYPHIIVDDIVRTLGIAEAQYGHGSGREKDFVYAIADSGIGLALMLNGAPYVGPLQMAGEIGHIPVGDMEIHCNCGNMGCLETAASATAILNKISTRLGSSNVRTSLRDNGAQLNIHQVIEAADTGDKVAYQALVEAGEYFGVGLAIVVNLLGPQLIVVGGSLAKSEVYLDAARRSMRLQVLGKASTAVRVEPSQLDEMAGARGAATQVLNRLFQSDNLNILDLHQESKLE